MSRSSLVARPDNMVVPPLSTMFWYSAILLSISMSCTEPPQHSRVQMFMYLDSKPP